MVRLCAVIIVIVTILCMERRFVRSSLINYDFGLGYLRLL
jgi:hypothetical protein